ncbi:golvesin C-terminal-like domain-containing protein [Streptomyces sundarbansensis]
MTVAVALAVAAGFCVPQASAAPAPAPRTTAAAGTGAPDTPQQGPQPSAVPADRRAAVLGEDFRESADRAVTSSGDGTGFHVMVAEERRGYAWRTAASLSEAGFEADSWIGNVCVTESGRYAAAAYAPRTFTNDAALMARGAFTAIVDLDTGSVRKLPFQASLSYFSPGCGTGDDVVFSQFTDELSSDVPGTRLITVGAASGDARRAELAGQVTSAVPAGGRIVAARGHRLVRIDGGEVREVASTHGVPFQLKPDADGGVTFIDRLPGGSRPGAVDTAAVSRVTPAQLRTPKATNRAQRLASGALTAFDLARAADGTVLVTGEAATERGRRLPASVRNPGGIAKDTRVSSHARAVLSTAWADGQGSQTSPQGALAARPARITMTSLGTGRDVTLDASTGDRVGAARQQRTSVAASPALPEPDGPAEPTGARAKPSAAPGVAAVPAASPVEAERTCSVPRGDVRLQAYQPTPRQIEWAVDQAVVGNLNARASRPADWRNTGMPAYAPQALFPLSPLTGGAGTEWRIPAQILLGITAQESNMWQATRYAVPGVSANPLIGNYYGVSYASDGEQGDPWAIDWSESDCGYGVTQVTDGMALPGKGRPTLSETQQRAVAVDYAANIAAGADILADKWNQTRADGLVVNNGEPKWMENWFYALWAYNSGYYPKADAATKNSGKWGVGWTNNPANPLWKENRPPFLEAANGDDDYTHAAHPQDWPYQEKVIGWAARPISAMFRPGEYAPGYRQASWNQVEYRTMAKPPVSMFCDGTNDCDPSKIDDGATNTTGGGPCLLPGEKSDPLYLKCWYHQPVAWKECGSAMRACGYPLHRFSTAYPEQDDPNPAVYPPRCSAGLPASTLVVDDVAHGVTPTGSSTATSTGPPARSCGAVSSPSGTFSFDFPHPSGRMDLHQIGAGYENHFWFSHTYRQYGTETPRTKVTGTWTLNTGNRGWMRIWAHLPDHGAHTRQARYLVSGTDSTSPLRTKPQRVMSNKWVSLGVFRFTGTPQVSLSNITDDGNGSEDVAWDAVGFEPLGAAPAHQIVAMGDSYASGEGVTEGAGGVDYYPESDYDDGRTEATRNTCHRSTKAWSRQASLPGSARSIGERADTGDPALDFQFVACSGARHYHLVGDGQNGEPGQLDQGYLDQHTTLVTLSVGGNDMRFADVVTACVNPVVPDCRGTSIPAVDPDTGEKAKSLETGPLSRWAPGWAHDIIRPRLARTLGMIQERAPNARIVLMGYPRLMSTNVCLDLISPEEKVWLDELADVVATELAGAVDDANRYHGTDAVFSDPREEFAGRGICGDPEGLNGIIVTGHSEADSRPVSMKSFHPNVLGARLYADSLEDTLNGG